MIDLKLDSSTHDIVIQDGDLALVTDATEVAQHCKTRLLFWMGEWILDFGEGTDWMDKIFTVHTSQEKRDKYIKDRILGTTGMKDLIRFQFGMDYSARAASIEFEATTDYGDAVQVIMV